MGNLVEWDGTLGHNQRNLFHRQVIATFAGVSVLIKSIFPF